MQIRKHRLTQACMGAERKLVSVHFGPQKSERKAYIQAGLHADEAPGYLVAARLLELLQKADEAGEVLQQIVIVPAANPIGLSQWGTDTLQGRFDNSDNINFNRRYDDLVEETAASIKGKLTAGSDENIQLIRGVIGNILRARKTVTEAEELKNLLLTLSHDADIVLDLHCDFEALVHIYMGRPLWPDGSDLSAQLGAEATLLAEDSGDNPFDEANSKIWWKLAELFPEYPIPPACFAATIELRGILDTDRDLVEQDAQNIFTFLKRRGYIAGEVEELPPLPAEATPLEGVDYVSSPTAGIITFLKKPGDLVKKDERIAEIINPLAALLNKGEVIEKTAVTCKSSGILYARSVDRFARPGKIIAKVAGKKPLAKKGNYLLTF